jgi:hypothetical protein
MLIPTNAKKLCMSYPSRALTALLPLFVFGSCIRVYTTPAPAEEKQAAKAPEKKSPFASSDSTLKDTRRIDGYFVTHLKRDNTLYVELRPEQFNREFGLPKSKRNK